MAFAYYDRLTRAQQWIYRRSDAVTNIPLMGAASLWPMVDRLARALGAAGLLGTRVAAERLLAGLTADLGVAPLRVRVLATRPARSWGELHGLYSRSRKGQSAQVTLWMRTARTQKVVAFRTFLRTLLHEFTHHLDYERLGLADSFHTEGFYKRESSLFHQLVEIPPLAQGSKSCEVPASREMIGRSRGFWGEHGTRPI